MNFQKILLAYSDPQTDQAVMKAALDLAHKYTASLTVLHINVRPPTAFTRAYRSFEQPYSKEEIKVQINNLNPHNVIVTIRITHGEPNYVVDDIIKTAADFDMLVMGHDHVSLLQELFTDSTDERVINRINTPTLVIPTSGK